MNTTFLSSREASHRILAIYWVVMYTATHWPDINRFKPETGWWIPNFGTVMHLSIYAGWTCVWWWTLRTRSMRLKGRVFLWFLIGTMTYAAFDEITQAIVGRTPDIADFFADMIGAVTAAMILRAIDRYIPMPQPTDH